MKLALFLSLKLVYGTTNVNISLKLVITEVSLSLKLALFLSLELVYDTAKVSISLKLAHH